MNIVVIAIVVILVFAIVGLIIYNINIHKKIQTYKNINQKITNLSVVQDFMTAIGETSSVEEKIKKINEILIEKYEIKYSTIVVFNGAEYLVKASNVDSKHWPALKRLQEVELFQDSISTATPKYITVNKEGERLPYQESEFGRAKSAIFFPLYIDNVYIGYWILESGTPHDFDNVDTTVLEVIRDNIVSVLKTVVHQKTLETIVRTDLFTGLKSEEYLYGEGKKVIDQYTVSTMCMYKIINLEYVNKNYSRELGNSMVTQISKFVEEKISSEYVFVRYMGPKFVIAFSGIDTNGVAEFLNELKSEIENLKINETGLLEKSNLNQEIDNNVSQLEQNTENYQVEVTDVKLQEYVSPILNFAISSYYKGTGLEEVLKKLEEYLDNAEETENDITSI